MSAFDIFLSYSRADQEMVERLGRALRERHLTVFVDRWYLVAGQSWPAALEEHLRDCRAFAVCIGASGVSGWQQREHYKALDRQAREPGFPVIPVLLPGADDPALGFLGLNTWVDLRRGVEDQVAVNLLARAVAGLPPDDRAALVSDPRAEVCPYRGLLPFREEDAPFIGREAFTARLIEKVRRNRLVAVAGPSGSGKSSVVRAGLVPALRRAVDGHIWDVLTLTPGRTPLHALLAVLSPAPDNVSRAARLGRIESDVALLRRHDLTIEAFAGEIFREQPGTDHLLLVVDQWEELYTQARSAHDRDCFVELILEATTAGPVTVVLTLRGDFYGRALEDREFADRLQNAVVNLGPMQPEELKRAVTEPAAKVGLGFEHGLVDRILEDVRSEPGNLPLLEFLLAELWASRERGSLSHRAYAGIGGVRGAIATRAEAELAKLTLEQQDALKQVMLRLVSPGEGQVAMRVRAPIPTGVATAEAVRAFADARLLTTGFDEAAGREMVEVSHEALIGQWNTYREWIDADREFIRTVDRIKGAMRAWTEETADKSSRLLAPGRPLEEARELLSRPDALIDDLRPFIEASIAHDDVRVAEEQHRVQAEKQREIDEARRMASVERGRRRAAVAGLIAALLLAVGAASLWKIAEERQDTAQRSESGLLANLSRQATLGGDAVVGMKSALQGLPRNSDRPERPLVNEAVVALDTALNAPYYATRILRGHERTIKSAVLAPDGRTIVTAAMDGTARLWDAATGIETAVFRGHEGSVTSAAFSPDGKTVVTASEDKTARIWDVASAREIAVLRGHQDAVHVAKFSPDGRSVITVAYNDSAMFSTREDTVRLWDSATGKQTATLRGHDGLVTIATFSPDGRTVITSSVDKTVRLWAAATGQEVAALRHESPLVFVSVSPDGKTIASAPIGEPPILWDVATRKQIAALRGHDAWISAAVFSADSRLLVTASMDHTARVWETPSGKWIAALRGHDGIINSVAFSPDASTILTSSLDATARLWDARTGQQVAVLRGYRGGMGTALFGQDLKTILTTEDNAARLWSATEGRAVTVLRGHENRVNFADFSPDGKAIATASWDGTARLWNAEANGMLNLRGHQNMVIQAAFSPDGKAVVTASHDQTARLWDAATGKEMAALRGHEGPVALATFSPDGGTVLTASVDGTARLWDRGTGQQAAVLRGHQGGVFSAEFSPDGRMILTASYDKTARLWDRSTLTEVAVLKGHDEPLRGADFSPDGKLLLTYSNDRTARLWDAAARKEIAVLKGHEERLNSASFSADSRIVVTASDDKTARLWGAPTGSALAVLRGHEDRVTRARISPDGRLVATASADRTVRVWERATGQEILTLHGHTADITSVAFSPDGKTLVTASSDRTARVWRTERPDLPVLVSEACRRFAQIGEAPGQCQARGPRTQSSK